MNKVLLSILYLTISHTVISNPKPNIKVFGPSETKGSGANWQIMQSREGYIFVASSAGLKYFDGYKWDLIKNRLNSEIYSLDIDQKSCITYCGGLEDFGFVDLDENNKFTYFSLYNLLPASQLSFGKIWQTLILDHVYYVSNKFIFEFDGKKITVHNAENNSFYKAFILDDTFIVQEEGVGLFRIFDNKKIFIKNSDHFNDKLIEYILREGDRIKLFFSDGVVAEASLDQNVLSDIYFTSYDISMLIRKGKLNRILKLYDDNYAFALGNAGVAITNKNKKIKYVFNYENNLINGYVNDIFEDQLGNIWTAEDHLIRFINYGSPYSTFNYNDGIKGIVNSFIELGNQILFSDQFNIYSIRDYKIQVIHRFEESIRKLQSIDESRYFVLTNKNLYLSKDKSIKKILEFNDPKNLFIYSKVTNTYGIYNNHQIFFFSLKGDKIQIEFGKVIDQVELNDVVVDDEGRIWFSTTSSGVGYYFEDRFKFFDTKSGLPGYFNNRVVKINHQVYILTEEGILRSDKYLNSLRKTSDFPEYFKNVFVTNILETKFGYLIKINNKNNENEYYLINQNTSVDDELNKIFRFLPKRGFAGWYLSSDEKLYISFIDNLFILDFNKSHRLHQPLEITIQNILYGQKGHFDSKNNRIILNYNHGPLKLIVTSPYFEGQDKITYFYRIKNYLNQWQQVSNSNEIIISSLNFGKYELEIFASNIYGINSKVKTIRIQVKPPWYLSIYFLISVIILLTGAFYYYQKFQDNLLIKKNKELETLINLRTKELLEEKNELERSKEELFQLSIQKNKLLGVYAHDLKNPLSAIDGIKDLLEATIFESDIDESTKKEVAQYLQMIKTSTNQMMSIIQDLLSSVKEETFKQKIEKRIMDINELISEHYALMNNYARQKNIKVIFNPKGKLLVNVDVRKIGEVFQNLISNAIKYSKENTTVTIDVNLEKRNNKEYVKVSIKDQGPGFTDEDKKKMFGLFQRLSAKPTKGESSTGLGLYIVKNYTELHDGFVELESLYGQGSTFHVFLPLVEKVV